MLPIKRGNKHQILGNMKRNLNSFVFFSTKTNRENRYKYTELKTVRLTNSSYLRIAWLHIYKK
jgi:hypothetical protein